MNSGKESTDCGSRMLCQDASDPVWASVHELIRRYVTLATFLVEIESEMRFL